MGKWERKRRESRWRERRREVRSIRKRSIHKKAERLRSGVSNGGNAWVEILRTESWAGEVGRRNLGRQGHDQEKAGVGVTGDVGRLPKALAGAPRGPRQC